MLKPTLVNIEVFGRTFGFQLHSNKCDLGAAGIATYHWMDNRQFRRRKGGPNFDACLDHYWTVMTAIEAHREYETQQSLVFAEIYRFVKGARTLQTIYCDAYPHERADKEIEILPGSRRVTRTHTIAQEDQNRIRQAIASRPVAFVKEELDQLLLVHKASPDDQPWINERFHAVIEDARAALAFGGRQGLQAHIANNVVPVNTKQRKRGKQDRERLFLNCLSYECKVAFHTAYANAWISILPELRLDPLSERLHRLWHHQNQPSEENHVEKPSDRWMFGGQVLALHPLSPVVFDQLQHRIVLGRWLNHPDYESIVTTENHLETPEYRDFLEMILVAGNEYIHARESDKAHRGTKVCQYNDSMKFRRI